MNERRVLPSVVVRRERPVPGTDAMTDIKKLNTQRKLCEVLRYFETTRAKRRNSGEREGG